MGKNVKGSIFVDMVKLIKKDKTGAFDKYLTDRDREIIDQHMLPSTWYPYETYRHCLEAMFEVVAKNSFEIAKEWGRTVCQKVMTGIYANVVKDRDPLSFIKKYQTTYRNFYDFGKTEIVVEGENQVIYKLANFDDQFVVIYHTIQGWIERGLELCGAKNVKSGFVTKSWEGKPFTSIRFTWTY